MKTTSTEITTRFESIIPSVGQGMSPIMYLGRLGVNTYYCRSGLSDSYRALDELRYSESTLCGSTELKQR